MERVDQTSRGGTVPSACGPLCGRMEPTRTSGRRVWFVRWIVEGYEGYTVPQLATETG